MQYCANRQCYNYYVLHLLFDIMIHTLLITVWAKWVRHFVLWQIQSWMTALHTLYCQWRSLYTESLPPDLTEFHVCLLCVSHCRCPILPVNAVHEGPHVWGCWSVPLYFHTGRDRACQPWVVEGRPWTGCGIYAIYVQSIFYFRWCYVFPVASL